MTDEQKDNSTPWITEDGRRKTLSLVTFRQIYELKIDTVDNTKMPDDKEKRIITATFGVEISWLNAGDREWAQISWNDWTWLIRHRLGKEFSDADDHPDEEES